MMLQLEKRIVTARSIYMHLLLLLLFDTIIDQSGITALTAPLPASTTSIQNFHTKTKRLWLLSKRLDLTHTSQELLNKVYRLGDEIG